MNRVPLFCKCRLISVYESRKRLDHIIPNNLQMKIYDNINAVLRCLEYD